jgi:hypothetical protein
MRKILLVLTLLWCIAVNAQYHCTIISATRSDVTLRSTGYGKNVKIAAKDAEQNAINTLLYAGAEGTSYSLPLIPTTRSEAESQNKNFFKDFYDTSYKDFIISSVTVTAFGKDAEKRKCVTLDVCVRAESLRSFLEKNGVIQKFGF